MGTWASGSFGNDYACDWAYGLETVKDLSLVENALDAVLSLGEDYVEAPTACEAIAAIEVIARLQGNWGVRDVYTRTMDQWVEKHNIQPTATLAKKALATIERIISDDSELKELWEESEDYEVWLSSVNNLKARITP